MNTALATMGTSGTSPGARPTIIETLEADGLLSCLGMVGESWATWHVILKAAYGLALTAIEVETFCSITGLKEYNPPPNGWRRVIIIAGRQSGKTTAVAAVADYESIYPLVEGDNLRAVLVAQDMESLKSTMFAYARMPFDGPLDDSVLGRTTTTITLDSGVTIKAYPCSSRAIRGPRSVVFMMDEFGFYRSTTGEPLEKRVADAGRFSTLTTNGKTWIISSPYDEGSELHRLYEEFYGKANPGTIVFQADTATLNPSITQETLDALRAQDPDAAVAELDAQFRKGLSKLFDMVNVRACVDTGRTERPFEMGTQYFGFADYASGTKIGLDRYAAAVAHVDKATRKVIIDSMRMWIPPFDPKMATKEAAEFFKGYNIKNVHGDKAALGFVAGEFRDAGITYAVTEGTAETASALILQLLPAVNSKSVVLLDEPEVIKEFQSVDRVLSQGGVEKTSHPRGTHDDALVCIAGVFAFAYRTIANKSEAVVDHVTKSYGRAVDLKPPGQIHTSAYDASSHELASLGQLTRNEQRLFNQGGAEAVREDRRFWQKERGGR